MLRERGKGMFAVAAVAACYSNVFGLLFHGLFVLCNDLHCHSVLEVADYGLKLLKTVSQSNFFLSLTLSVRCFISVMKR